MKAPTFPRDDHYRNAADAPRVAIGQGRAAVYDPLQKKVDVLSQTEAEVLGAAGFWGTLDDLSARAAGARHIGTRAALKATLTDLHNRGLLPSEADLIARLVGEGSVHPPLGGNAAPQTSIKTIGIPTRGRPACLERALASYSADIANNGLGDDVSFTVIDEADGEGAAEGQRIAAEATRKFGVAVRYAARHEKALFVRQIVELSGAPKKVVEEALIPSAPSVFAAGAARNLLLLDSVSHASIQVDDDTFCELRTAPSARSRLRLHSFDDHTDFWFGEDVRDAETPSHGLVLHHDRLLGWRGSDLVRRALSEGQGASADAPLVDLSRASTGLLSRVMEGGRVACTQAGIRGDSAMGAMGYLLTISEPSRARLLVSEAHYRRVIEHRRLTRAVTTETLTDQELCMTFSIGLDGRLPLPPFPPLHRNEDGLFGVVLAASEPTVLFGHVPLTVAHEPENQRQKPFDHVFNLVGRIGINDLLAGLVASSKNEIVASSPEVAFVSLGQRLIEWSDLGTEELFTRVRWMLVRRLAQRLHRVETLLRETKRTPAFWARDLDQLAEVLRERLEGSKTVLPFEWDELGDPDKAARRTKESVRSFGELLTVWPAMLDAARTLQRRGIRLGVEGS